ncbi:hypothetical protein CYMTET_25233 [Cymbomonas tetramitiformis]|uniref:Uncharacterized protein n=1 Tax=Cymbomonas tetramitiformis TaxID=36881 RepID=A0AAE0FV04_9CHLO|nr:hypothetical protein CYMTET_25233 [Cymbomonas tetramitiformis]
MSFATSAGLPAAHLPQALAAHRGGYSPVLPTAGRHDYGEPAVAGTSEPAVADPPAAAAPTDSGGAFRWALRNLNGAHIQSTAACHATTSNRALRAAAPARCSPSAAYLWAATSCSAAAAATGGAEAMEHTHLEQQLLLQSDVAVADDAVQYQLALLAATQQPSLLDRSPVFIQLQAQLGPSNHLTRQRPARQRVTWIWTRPPSRVRNTRGDEREERCEGRAGEEHHLAHQCLTRTGCRSLDSWCSLPKPTGPQQSRAWNEE